MLNFVLCDDNPNLLEKMETILESIFIKNNLDAQIIFKSTNPHFILEYVEKNPFNVLILDIDLKSNISGIELAKKIRKTNKNAYLIFTTGHLEYAMLAYKLKTFDYLPKPITSERLEETIDRLIKDIENIPKKYIKLGNGNTFISQDDINFIKKDGMKLVFYTSNKNYETYSSFNKIESCLPENFVRCHKSYIANIKKISNIETQNNIILFDNKDSCSIGPKYKTNLMEVFNNYGNFSNNVERIDYTK